MADTKPEKPQRKSRQERLIGALDSWQKVVLAITTLVVAVGGLTATVIRVTQSTRQGVNSVANHPTTAAVPVTAAPAAAPATATKVPPTTAPVAAPPVPLANWPHTATFNGTNSQATLPGPALDTGAGASFTVSAWVDLYSTSDWATAVSQDTAVSSSFFLQYSLGNAAWAFSRVITDTVDAGAARALSTTPPVTGQWTHLVGVYDASDGQLSLYVNAILQGTARDITPFAGQGDVVIGRARSNDGDSDWFPGMIKDVEVFQQALTASQISALS
jgi:concanavalin A-like lectin/glucanase superfamily protein